MWTPSAAGQHKLVLEICLLPFGWHFARGRRHFNHLIPAVGVQFPPCGYTPLGSQDTGRGAGLSCDPCPGSGP
eukprot:gene16450-biopygen18797